MSRDPQQYLRVEIVDDIAVVSFAETSILAEDVIQGVSDQLTKLVEENQHQKLLLNFSNVKFLSSSLLGTLVKINRKVVANKSKLKICCLEPQLKEIFQISRFDRLFEIHDEERVALDRF